MSHKANQILNAIEAKLAPLLADGTIALLLRSRVQDPDDYPALIIRMGDDTPTNANAQFQDAELTVNTDIYVNSTEDDLDSKTLAVRLAVHKALMADRSQGLSFVQDTMPLGQSAPDYTGEGEDYAGATRLTWQVRYRSNLLDPSL